MQHPFYPLLLIARCASGCLRALRRHGPTVLRHLWESQLVLLMIALVALTAIMGSRMAHAQSGGAQQAPPAAAAARQYAIPAGPLGGALSRFAAHSGVLLSFDPALVRGLQAPALSGRHGVDEGLRRLLSSSGLQARRQPDGSYVVQAGAPVITHPTLTVRDERLRDPADDVYTQPRSTAYISAEDLDRFGRISAGDALKGVAGVQVGDTRNGGALDVNIRGIQGQNRVAVTVDGAQQSIDVYRGYAGTQQRSYIDPDLLGGVVVSKGPGLEPGATGAIGGTVQMRTLEAQDILADGSSFGLRIKGDIWDNGVSAPWRSGERARRYDPELYSWPRTERGNLVNSSAQSGSVAVAHASETLELVAAFARRQQGNYFAGHNGHEGYRRFDNRGVELHTVANTYQPGEEVLNSSSLTESALLKARLKPAQGHQIDLGYMHYEGQFGEIMPSDVFRYDVNDPPIVVIMGHPQYPVGSMRIDTLTSRYRLRPDNPLIDLDASLWLTRARNNQLSGVTVPLAEQYLNDRGWVKQDNLRVGGTLNNRSLFETGAGDFKLDLGGSFQVEDIRPQDGVVITQRDRNINALLQDAKRQEYSLSGRLAYQPAPDWELWAGGRYSSYRTQDRNSVAYYLFDPVTDDFLGYGFRDPVRSSDSGFAPGAGVSYRLSPQTLLYASHTQGLRLPSLFETSMGLSLLTDTTSQVLRPERAKSWELGLSGTYEDLLRHGDSASFKIAYFDNDIQNYITRYFRWRGDLSMWLSNADSFRNKGLELQSRYDNGRFFGDLSATYYLETRTCDAGFAAYLRSIADSLTQTQNTPDCVNGAFMGSYSAVQNPPKLAVNLTLGARLLDRRLTVGTRIMRTSGPGERMDQPWHQGATTWQIDYRGVTVVDAFLSYRLRKNLLLSAGLTNITDRFYLDPLAQSLMPAPGRTLRVGMQVWF